MNSISPEGLEANRSMSAAGPPTSEEIAAEQPPRICMLVNRKAGGGSIDLGPGLETLASAFGPPMTFEVNESQQLETYLREPQGASVECVVIAGGDGTINSALDVLLRSSKKLGILPLGTANDFARTLGIPADLDAAADIIVQGTTRRVDVGIVNGRHFLNAAGIGFSTQLPQELQPWTKRRLGPLAYPVGVVKRWRRHRPFWIEIRNNGTARRLRAIQVTVANGRYYGGGMLAEQGARVDDGRLDLIVVLPRRWWQHAPSIVGLKRGVYSPRAPIVAERHATFELSTRRPHAVATDGEPCTSTPASFSVLPGGLEVYAP